MRLKIKDFGKIQEAEIDWNGLTVIAGKNDTGKSTIGKLFFVIVKTFASYSEVYKTWYGIRLCRRLIDALSGLLRGTNRVALKENVEQFKLLESIYENLVQNFKPGFLSKKGSIYNYPQLHESSKTLLQQLLSQGLDASVKGNLELLLHDLSKDLSAEEMFDGAFRLMMNDCFRRNYNNSLHSSDTGEIDYILEDTSNLHIKIKDNKIEITSLDVSKKNPFYEDITYIDFPGIIDERFQHLYLSNLDWTDDLLDKTSRIKTGGDAILDDLNDIIGNLQDALGAASFFVDKDSNEFKYKVSDTASPLNIINIASGSKAFGLIYMLIKHGIITRNTPLILDEPENHLHPEWQVIYAKFLVHLVLNGFNVLLTSHSPAFIQTLIQATVANEIWNTKRVNFYLAELSSNANYSYIRNVNKSVNDIFESLSKPIEALWRE